MLACGVSVSVLCALCLCCVRCVASATAQGVEPELAALPPTEGGGCTAGELERQASAEEAGQGHGVDLSHDLALASSDGLETSFTNYVRGYIGCLGVSPLSLSSVSICPVSWPARWPLRPRQRGPKLMCHPHPAH